MITPPLSCIESVYVTTFLESSRLWQPYDSPWFISNYAGLDFSTNVECHCRLGTKAVLGTETDGLVANVVATGIVMFAFHAI